MILPRTVGLLAFSVTLLTATTLLADPQGSKNRDWLRQPTQRAVSAAAPTQLSAGKWGAIVLLTGLGGFALWKRKRVARTAPTLLASKVQITGVTKLSPKAQLMVATVNGRSMLLGVTDANITRLMWLDGAEQEEADDDLLPRSERNSDGEHQATRGEGDIYPNRLGVRRAVQPTAIEGSLPTKPTKSRRQPSRFREVLADAIGLAPSAVAEPVLHKAPVDELIASATDRYIARDARRVPPARAKQPGSANGPLIDVEGQAAGLVARLNRSGP